jgi:hypothetical protein
VAEVKASELDAGSNSKSELERGRQIIDSEPSATVATTKLQLGELDEPKEGERLFHSQMWVKGTPLHFIVDSGSQKNLISAEFVKWLALLTMPHPQPYTIVKYLYQICKYTSIRPRINHKPFTITWTQECRQNPWGRVTPYNGSYYGRDPLPFTCLFKGASSYWATTHNTIILFISHYIAWTPLYSDTIT